MHLTIELLVSCEVLKGREKGEATTKEKERERLVGEGRGGKEKDEMKRNLIETV